jgi:hypothetical protein
LKEDSVVFHDVPVSTWFATYVHGLLRRKIASGYADASGLPLGLFGPDRSVTYAELAKMALEAAGVDHAFLSSARNRRAQGHWAQAYITRAESLGFSVFTPSLNIDLPASRGEVIQTLLEAFGVPLEKEATYNPFHDLPVSHPHRAAILTAVQMGIIEGDRSPSGELSGTVRPDAPNNRAEVAKIILLMLETTGK